MFFKQLAQGGVPQRDLPWALFLRSFGAKTFCEQGWWYSVRFGGGWCVSEVISAFSDIRVDISRSGLAGVKPTPSLASGQS
jgi:hypothetical protein